MSVVKLGFCRTRGVSLIAKVYLPCGSPVCNWPSDLWLYYHVSLCSLRLPAASSLHHMRSTLDLLQMGFDMNCRTRVYSTNGEWMFFPARFVWVDKGTSAYHIYIWC